MSASAIPPMRFEHPEIGALARLAVALDEAGAGPRSTEGSMRERIGEIGRKAEAIQLAAGITCQAIEVLGEMEEALVFARDSAEEARSLRSMPASGVELLQKQVDLAVNCIDYLAAEASFAGRRVFDGETVEAGAASVTLPKLSSDRIGARAVSDLLSPRLTDWRAGAVDFSQSVASATTGGPNSLGSWPDGAAAVITAGAREIGGMRGELISFYSGAVLPTARDVAVSVSNVVASDFAAASLEEAVSLLSQVKGDFPSEAAPPPSSGEGVLRLLD